MKNFTLVIFLVGLVYLHIGHTQFVFNNLYLPILDARTWDGDINNGRNI